MVARKSTRVKKSPVVYQAPEPAPRASRTPSTPKQPVVNRRIFAKDVELQMECVEEDLSPAQVKAMKEAQQEHDKANEMIKEVRAGNILVPSSQPNTFTIVPPKAQQTPPSPVAQQQAPQFQSPAISQQTPLAQYQTPPTQHQTLPTQHQVTPPQVEETGHQSLPPPRPAQFLNKHLQEMNKAQAPRSQDVLLISDSGPKITSQPLQFQLAPISQQVTISTGPGVMPQQVYKFVSLPSTMQPSIVQNQWALRPLLTVPPQQQVTMIGTTPQGVHQFTMAAIANRMASPKPQPGAAAAQIVRIADVGNKRPASSEPLPELAAKKKMAKGEVQDDTGNWVPLDEYYYGTHEGEPSYTEEKGEYRFKCWYCSKMLYNNVRAMQHIQGHIDASKQQNIDLSDLTQCKNCYKQFDTPFEMQTHVEKVHLSNKVLMCRICERDFTTQRDLTVHMKGNHHACEMPYVCQLCNFRSSMYSDVVDHFKKKHDSSHYLLCLYCLRTFEVKFVSQGWGQTQTFYGHLLKHQTKSSTKKCLVCRLTFFNAIDVKNHRKNCHVGNQLDVKASGQGVKVEPGQQKKRGSQLKSLNAPSVSRIQDYGTVLFPEDANMSNCIECKMLMSSTDHYKKYVHCTMCRFATSCSVAYAKHMMGFHSGQMSSLNMNIPWERPMKNTMYCACGFKSNYGNKIANHLVFCGKWTCYSKQLQGSELAATSKVEEKKDGSLLGMLGLVSKDEVTPSEEAEIISRKPHPKSKLKAGGSTLVKGVKGAAKTVAAKGETLEHAKSESKVKNQLEVKSDDDQQSSAKDLAKSEKQEVLEKDKVVFDKSGKDTEAKPNKNTGDEKSERQDDVKDQSVENEGEIKLNEDVEESALDTEVKEVKDRVGSTRELDKKAEDKETEDSTKANVKDLKQNELSEVTMETEVDGQIIDKYTEDAPKDIPEQMDVEENVIGETRMEADKVVETKSDSKIEEEKQIISMEDETTKKEDSDMEETIGETYAEEVSTVKKKEKANVTDGGKVVESLDKDSDTVAEKDPDISEEQGKGDISEGREAKPETEQERNEEPIGETEKEQKSNKDEETKDKTPSEHSSHGNRERRESQSSDHASREHEHRSHDSDRRSHDRDSRSSDRDHHSSHRDRHSSDRDHHSGGRHDDHRHDNRSHGSYRSDSYHGNRPYDHDRDRSHDRDYNRNQGYRQDNRSGYGGYQDNRSQGYGGGGGPYRGHGGQYGGYQGNRGGHYQDRGRGGNYYQNRGGYHQNYRGGGYGGGYY